MRVRVEEVSQIVGELIVAGNTRITCRKVDDEFWEVDASID